jgi:hypothetical protein
MNSNRPRYIWHKRPSQSRCIRRTSKPGSVCATSRDTLYPSIFVMHLHRLVCFFFLLAKYDFDVCKSKIEFGVCFKWVHLPQLPICFCSMGACVPGFSARLSFDLYPAYWLVHKGCKCVYACTCECVWICSHTRICVSISTDSHVLT